jgi:hypothetical protein
MKTHINRSILAALMGVAFTEKLHAQPTAITYQGQFRDNGNPSGGVFDLRFTVYDLENGGSAVGGSITNSFVAVSNGLFTVTLAFESGVFDGGESWLETGQNHRSPAGVL